MNAWKMGERKGFLAMPLGLYLTEERNDVFVVILGGEGEFYQHLRRETLALK